MKIKKKKNKSFYLLNALNKNYQKRVAPEKKTLLDNNTKKYYRNNL